MEQVLRRRTVGYVVLTYFVFWLFLGLIGALIALRLPAVVITILKNLSSWTPTITVAILFRSLYPGVTLGAYLKSAFQSKVGIWPFALLLAVQGAIALAAVGASALSRGHAGEPIAFMGLSALPGAILLHATSGPGEELGWRGFLLNDLLERRTPFAAGIVVGLIWGFWHTPLWFLSGYTHARLLLYIACFLVTIVSMSIIMTVFYGRRKNILIAMWIHFLFNILLRLANIGILTALVYSSIGYLLFAVALLVVFRGWLFSGKRVGAVRRAA